jgi:hypothetical protein
MSMLRFDLAFPDEDACWRLLENIQFPWVPPAIIRRVEASVMPCRG